MGVSLVICPFLLELISLLKGSKHKLETIEIIRLRRQQQDQRGDSPFATQEAKEKLSRSLKRQWIMGTRTAIPKGYKWTPEALGRILHGIRNNRYNEAYAKKLSDTKLGTLNPQHKVNPDEVLEILRLYETGMYKTSMLGNMFGISRQSVNDIIAGRTWSHVTGIKR